jgi:hypothetical protein
MTEDPAAHTLQRINSLVTEKLPQRYVGVFEIGLMAGLEASAQKVIDAIANHIVKKSEVESMVLDKDKQSIENNDATVTQDIHQKMFKGGKKKVFTAENCKLLPY